ncbi:MAG: hypothetical protein AB7K68_12255 [Bacteriovoracia bacterium]
MKPGKARLQRQALALRKIPGIKTLYRLWYSVGRRLLTRFAGSHAEVISVYLRRGGGRDELVPGASDLDFFLVLETLPAEQEMEFLKRFWAGYHRLRWPFPFLGEVLMGDENELRAWLSTPGARAYEARFSWKLLRGKDCLQVVPVRPDLRDLFSESLKHFSDLLQSVLKLRPEEFHAGIASHQAGAVHLRHAAKAALDLFRFHASAFAHNENLWRASRLTLTEILPPAYGANLRALQPILRLDSRPFGEDPFAVYSALAHTAIHCLHEMASALTARGEEEAVFAVSQKAQTGSDPYSLSVRELFAERTLLRHSEILASAVLSENTAAMYFTMPSPPSLEELRALMLDLREVSFSFDRLSVAMPLTVATFRELERTSLLDSPFHSFCRQREIKADAAGNLETKPYEMPPARIPLGMLRKTFAELSFGLRLEPTELPHFLDKIVGMVLGLRLAADHREVSADFRQALSLFGVRYPLRVEHLKAKIHPYVSGDAEEKIWDDIYSRLAEEQGTQADFLRSQLGELRRKNGALAGSQNAVSDLWINLTPFLRMEMNAMKEKYFEERPVLKI